MKTKTPALTPEEQAARDAFRKEMDEINALRKETQEKVMTAVVEIVKSSRIYGYREREQNIAGGFSDSLYFDFERAWAVSATLYVKLQTEDFRLGTLRFETTIGWSTTFRDVSNALAAVALYREIVELAAGLEAAFATVVAEHNRRMEKRSSK